MRIRTRVPGRLLPTFAGLLLAFGWAAGATSTGGRSADVASPSDGPSSAATSESPAPADASPGDSAQPSEAPGASGGVARLVVIVALGALVAMLVAVRYAARLYVLAALRER